MATGSSTRGPPPELSRRFTVSASVSWSIVTCPNGDVVDPDADEVTGQCPDRRVGLVLKERAATRLQGGARTARFEVRVTNRGDSTDRMRLTGTPRNRSFKVSYLSASGQDVTRAVTAGTYLTGRLAPGRSTGMIVTVTRTKAAVTGDRRTFRVRAVSWHGPTASDTVAAAVRLTR
jgi:hypothetical protein